MPPETETDVRSPGKPPQFGLRSTFWLMAALAVVFSLMAYIGPAASAALILISAVIGLHVAGNAIGTSLRDTAPIRDKVSRPQMAPISRLPRPAPRLCERTPLRWPIRAMSLAMGGACGLFGATLLHQWTESSVSSLAVVTMSFTLLGVLFGFLIGSFAEILLRAWSQATNESSNDRSIMPAARR